MILKSDISLFKLVHSFPHLSIYRNSFFAYQSSGPRHKRQYFFAIEPVLHLLWCKYYFSRVPFSHRMQYFLLRICHMHGIIRGSLLQRLRVLQDFRYYQDSCYKPSDRACLRSFHHRSTGIQEKYLAARHWVYLPTRW